MKTPKQIAEYVLDVHKYLNFDASDTGKYNISEIDKLAHAVWKLEEDKATLLDAVNFYAAKTGESEWEGAKFLTFDKFGGLCPEIMGPYVANEALAKVTGERKEK